MSKLLKNILGKILLFSFLLKSEYFTNNALIKKKIMILHIANKNSTKVKMQTK